MRELFVGPDLTACREVLANHQVHVKSINDYGGEYSIVRFMVKKYSEKKMRVGTLCLYSFSSSTKTRTTKTNVYLVFNICSIIFFLIPA